MVVNMNGNFWFDTEESELQPDEMIVAKLGNRKLRKIAIALWTLSGSFFSKMAMASSGSFYQEMQPLYHVFQDMALGFGGLAILAGLVLLVVKKRWGASTLKMTAIIVGGAFVVPSALMLMAIIGTMLNDALWQALENVRDANEVKGVMGK